MKLSKWKDSLQILCVKKDLRSLDPAELVFLRVKESLQLRVSMLTITVFGTIVTY